MDAPVQLKEVMKVCFDYGADEVNALFEDVTSLLTQLGTDWQSPSATFESVTAQLSHISYAKIGLILYDVVRNFAGLVVFTMIGTGSAIAIAVFRVLDLVISAPVSTRDALRAKASAIKQNITDALQAPGKQFDAVLQSDN